MPIGAVVIELIFAGVAPRVAARRSGAAASPSSGCCAPGSPCASRAPSRRPCRGCSARLRAWQAGVLAAGALWGAAAWLFSAVRQRPAPDRARARRLHLLRRLRADPGAAVPPVRRSSCCSSSCRRSPASRSTAAPLGWQIAAGDDGGDGDDAAARPQLPRRVRARRRAEAAHRGARRRSCAPRRRSPTRRATRPRSPTAPRRSSSPPPATTCASRCTRWACSPRRCARARTSRRWRSSSTASTSRSTRSRACSPSCSTSPASTAAASRSTREQLRARRHLPQAAPALRAGGVREGPGAALPRRPARRPRRSAAGRADPAQPGLERDPLHRRRHGAGQLPAPRRAGCCCRCGTPARASAPRSARASSRSSTRCRARRRPAAEQKKGLGLGLAIVKRLARADGGAARRCAREPGRGTVFTLELPLGQGAAHAERVDRRQGADRHHARRPPDRRSSRTSRRCARASRCCSPAGARRIVSFDERRRGARLGAGRGPGATRPALLIADYRLEHGETGVDAIARAARALRPRRAGDRRHRQQHDRPREGGARARLPPAHQAGAAEQAAGDDRVQAEREERGRSLARERRRGACRWRRLCGACRRRVGIEAMDGSHRPGRRDRGALPRQRGDEEGPGIVHGTRA